MFWFEKSASIILPLFVVASFIVLIFYAFATTAFVEPADQAPFVQEMVKDNAVKTKSAAEALDTSHRTETEMKTYLTKVASETLSFNKGNFKEVFKNIRPYFTEAGFKKYQQYLLDSNIAETVRTQDVSVSGYVDAPPFFLNSSVMNNTYKWLYEIPIVISFIPTNRQNSATESEQFNNNEILLRLQITRVTDLDKKFDGMKIEDWNVVPR